MQKFPWENNNFPTGGFPTAFVKDFGLSDGEETNPRHCFFLAKFYITDHLYFIVELNDCKRHH